MALQVEVPPTGVGQGRPTPLSAIDIEHEDFEWLRAYLQRNSSETTPLSDASTQGECVGRKHKSHHSSSHSTTSENYSTCDSPTEEHRTINSDSEGSRETEGPAKRRKVGWTSTEDMVILASVRKLGTQWPRIASQLPGRTADAVNPALPRARPPCMPSHPFHPAAAFGIPSRAHRQASSAPLSTEAPPPAHAPRHCCLPAAGSQPMAPPPEDARPGQRRGGWRGAGRSASRLGHAVADRTLTLTLALPLALAYL